MSELGTVLTLTYLFVFLIVLLILARCNRR
jgi:hypothetical protein